MQNPNSKTDETPLARWQRIRRAVVQRADSGAYASPVDGLAAQVRRQRQQERAAEGHDGKAVQE